MTDTSGGSTRLEQPGTPFDNELGGVSSTAKPTTRRVVKKVVCPGYQGENAGLGLL